ncbi:MAG: gamma carbonic anhydrase family protein [Alphaproteobacteria bacterium]|nr:MAG: gamma carbonic anhydrase family protein [Alphaproteobacteria bacterium]
MIFSLGDRRLKVHGDDYFVAPSASVIGSVELGHDTGIWFGATLRGDMDWIRVGDNSNIQDGSVVHVSEKEPCVIGKNVTVGHMCMLHSCFIGDNSLVGNGAIILDRARIGQNVIVAANSMVAPDKEIPDGVVVMGSPAKIVREVTEKDLWLIDMSWKVYVENARRFRSELKREDG